MRIIYSAGNRPGAGIQLYRFLQAGAPKEIKIAAYIKSSRMVRHVDWTLDAIEHKKDLNEQLTNEVKRYNPDLIISDCDIYLANIAHDLSIKLLYCSPINVINGVVWKKKEFKYTYLRNILNKFPPGETFVYSPMGDLETPPPLNGGFTWVTPYHNVYYDSANSHVSCLFLDTARHNQIKHILNHEQIEVSDDVNNAWCVISGGETSFVADALYNDKKILIAPNTNDSEGLLNANLCSIYNAGHDLGQIELLKRHAPDYIQKFIEQPTYNIISKQGAKYLHERLTEL